MVSGISASVMPAKLATVALVMVTFSILSIRWDCANIWGETAFAEKLLSEAESAAIFASRAFRRASKSAGLTPVRATGIAFSMMRSMTGLVVTYWMTVVVAAGVGDGADGVKLMPPLVSLGRVVAAAAAPCELAWGAESPTPKRPQNH